MAATCCSASLMTRDSRPLFDVAIRARLNRWASGGFSNLSELRTGCAFCDLRFFLRDHFRRLGQLDDPIRPFRFRQILAPNVLVSRKAVRLARITASCLQSRTSVYGIR